ncbi:MAG: elongation factor P [Bdellovibrionales bacterium]|nr:elongation factor P [Bdellovibrionales bacterium]
MIAKNLKVGMVINYEGHLFRVMSIHLIAPGNWRSFAQAKLRKLSDGTQKENRFRSDENVERAILDQREVEYLYQEDTTYHFMDTTSYEQFQLQNEDLGDAINYLIPNMKINVEFYEGKPIGVALPKTVNLKVVETEPYVKTATATSQYKPAKVETGATFQVPGFVTEGESIQIDTETGKYLGRTN